MSSKRLVLIIGFQFLIISLFSTRLWCAEDLSYLQAELAETRRKYEVVHLERAKAEQFLNNYEKNFEALKNAYHELDELQKKVSDILKKNLIKSMLKLGLETVDKIETCTDLAGKSVAQIIAILGTAAVGDMMQDRFSTPYSVAVGKLSEEVTKTYPELKRVNEIIRMNSVDIKFEMLKSGEDPSSLGETGIIYRKLVMILEAIENAKKKLYDLRKELERAKQSVLSSIDKIVAEDERLKKRMDELQERFQKALAEVKTAELEQENIKIESIASFVSNVKPKYVVITKEDEKSKLKASLLAQLENIINKKRKKSSEIWGIVDEKIGSNLDLKIFSKSVEEVKSCTVEELRNDIELGPKIIKDYKEKISIGTDCINEYSKLIDSAKTEILPILEQLAGLGDTEGKELAKNFFKETGRYVVKLENFTTTMEENIKVLQKNLNKYKTEFTERLNKAKIYQDNFLTDSEGVINAAIDAATKADNAVKTAAKLGIKVDTPGYLEIRIIPEIKTEFKKMFNEGKNIDEIKEYINKKKKDLLNLYDLVTKAVRARKLRDNMAKDLIAKYPDIGGLHITFREEGFKDVYKEFNDKYTEYVTPPNVVDNMLKIDSLNKQIFDILDNLNDLLVVLNKIKDINTKVSEVFEKEGYSKGMDKMASIISELDSVAGDLKLTEWFDTTPFFLPTGKKVQIYKILSSKTQEIIEEARKKEGKEITKREEEERIKKQEEERKRQEEYGLQFAKSQPGGLASLYGYYIINPRLNTYSLPGAFGEVVLLKNDLKQGQIELTGRLSHLNKVNKILISIDNGLSWTELDKNQDISYSFSPLPDKRYKPIIRIKTADFQDIDIPFFSNIDYLVYRNIDYNQLVAETIKKIAEAYETQNLGLFSEYVSRDYLGNKNFLIEGVRLDFDLFTDIKLTIYINRIEKRANMFVAETKWDKIQTPKKTGQQQRTSGNTTFMFVWEEGKMKIKNLRGNLIYATLSPEIAQASGLSQKTVEQIRTARDERNPVQPGAGTTEDSGGVSSSGIITVQYSPTVTAVGWPGTGFDFTANSEVAWNDPNSDVTFESNMIFGDQFQEVSQAFDELTEAPSSGYTSGGLGNNVGKVFVFITKEGYYGKMEILTFSDLGGGIFSLTFKFALQTDGSRNLRTK